MSWKLRVRLSLRDMVKGTIRLEPRRACISTQEDNYNS